MKSFLTFCIFLLLSSFTNAQEALITGNIKNFSNKTLLLFKFYGDTLYLADSITTSAKGDFTLSLTNSHIKKPKYVREHPTGMYLIWLNKMPRQYFYVLYNNKPIEVKTYCKAGKNNTATDSLAVIKSDENKSYYDFIHLTKRTTSVKNHNVSESEYSAAYKAMEEFVKKYLPEKESKIKNKVKSASGSMLAKIALAYYEPVMLSWKLPKYRRDSIIEAHYFDYFNPVDSSYLNTNILKDKVDSFITIASNKVDKYGRQNKNLLLQGMAAQTYLDRIKDNNIFFNFYLNYLLKTYRANHKETVFLYLYDLYLKPQEGDCESENPQFNWARDYVNILKNISKGSVAPDFKINDTLRLSQIKTDYTILIFWASWCTHCHEMLPAIKEIIDNFSKQERNKLTTVAISLDTKRDEWQKYIKDNSMNSFLHFSELKGWKSQVVKIYNIIMTPSIFVLDRNKKIIAAKISSSTQLENTLKTIR